jgi:hypothetical protein
MRKPTLSAKQLATAKAAGATSVVVEENGRKVEVRFVEPGAASTATANPWDTIYDPNPKRAS